MIGLLKRWIRYSVVRKGGTSPLWAAIGVLGVMNSLRKRYAGPQVTSILNDGIRPGEVIEIRHTGKPSKEVRADRAKKAALLAQLRAVDPGRKGKAGRNARKLNKKLDRTVIQEMATGKTGSTTKPVTDLYAAAASALGSGDEVVSDRRLRLATKAARRAAKAQR